MVGLAYKHDYSDGAVLEPSCGIGRFLHYFAPVVQVDAFEINEVSQRIAQLNFPTFNIRQAYFNELFIERNGKSKAFSADYKLVIGNPPYGDFTGKYSSKERKTTGATRYEDYFLLRGLDVLQSGGLLIYIIPSSFLDGKTSKAKERIHQQAELIDAYRLPKRIFKQTDIQTDIVVFQKH
jgi:adenine-specific DNA methylase